MTPAEYEAAAPRVAAMSPQQRRELDCAGALVHLELVKADAETLRGYLDRGGKAGKNVDARRGLALAIQAADGAAKAVRELDALTAFQSLSDARGCLLHVAGECIGLALGRVRADGARAAADKRHAPTRDAKRLVLTWWDANRGAMNKEQAADAIVAARLVSEKRATVRRWLRGA